MQPFQPGEKIKVRVVDIDLFAGILRRACALDHGASLSFATLIHPKSVRCARQAPVAKYCRTINVIFSIYNIDNQIFNNTK